MGIKRALEKANKWVQKQKAATAAARNSPEFKAMMERHAQSQARLARIREIQANSKAKHEANLERRRATKERETKIRDRLQAKKLAGGQPKVLPKPDNKLHTPGLAQTKAAVNAQVHSIMNDPRK